LDTTKYTTGVHTIHWIATDDAGAVDGIGSRYFNIVNTGTAGDMNSLRVPDFSTTRNIGDMDSFRVPDFSGVYASLRHREERSDAAIPTIESLSNLPVSFEPLRVKTGFDFAAPPESVMPDNFGASHIEIKEVELLEISLDPHNPPTLPLSKGGEDAWYSGFRQAGGDSHYSGYLIVGDELRPLPIGSTLDARTGRFSWLPGPGFVGTYDMIFLKDDGWGAAKRFPVCVTIRPKLERR
jgi:hypothetical protein